MEEKKIAQEQQNNSKVPPQLQAHVYKKGQSGNPSGRPKGTSLKEYMRNNFIYMTADEKEEYLHGIPKKEIWAMSEGNPDTKTDITTKGEKIEFTPKVAEVVKEFEEKLKGTL